MRLAKLSAVSAPLLIVLAGAAAVWAATGTSRRGDDEVKRAALGSVRAELRIPDAAEARRTAQLRIVRRGRAVFDRPLVRVGCRGVDCPGWHPMRLRVLRLDGDEEPEVIVDAHTGGAHCCLYSLLYRFLPGRQSYVYAAQRWGEAGYRYQLGDLDGDRRPEFVARDDRFAGVFTAFAVSTGPVRVWRYERGRMRVVTSRFPQLVARDAASLWRRYLIQREGGEVRGLLAAYMAEKGVLGQDREGRRRLDMAYRRGDLGFRREEHGYPAGRRYLSVLRTFLRRTGYLR